MNKSNPLFLKVCAILTAAWLGGSTYICGEPVDISWYNESYIHAHASVNLRPQDLGSVVDQIRKSGVDAVQFHVYNRPFWDAIYEAKAKENLGLNLVATINDAGTWRQYHEDSPDLYQYRIGKDGKFAGRWHVKHLCFNSPGVQDWIIPERYHKLPKELDPDQVWIDENVITVNLCYCEHCIKRFILETGEEPPRDLRSDNFSEWERWVTFHRQSFERWMEQVSASIAALDRNILTTFNHAYFVSQPESPPDYIRNLSADIHNDSLEIGYFSRYAGSGFLPFDIVTGLSVDVWAGADPKSLERVLNDISLVIAHGGKWNIGEFPTNRTTLRQEERHQGAGFRPVDAYTELAVQGAEFARERRPYSDGTKSVASVALLHSARTHYAKVIRNANVPSASVSVGVTSDGEITRNQMGETCTRVFWPKNRPVSESVLGSYLFLLESHIPFDFINEDQLRETIDRYDLVVLAEQNLLDPETIPVLQKYLRNGGRIISTGTTSQAGIPIDEGGKYAYLGYDFFRQFYERSGYSYDPHGDTRELHQMARGILAALNYEPEIEISAPRWFESTIRARNGSRYVHLINRGINWKLETDGGSDPGEIIVRMPAADSEIKVRLQPGEEEVFYNLADGRLTIKVPLERIDHHKIIEISK